MFSKETVTELKRMILFILGMAAIMVGVFAICGVFDYTVILGALLGVATAYLNFVLLAVAVERAVKEGKNPKAVVATSYTLRMLMIAAIIIFAIKCPYINYVATVIPLIFPRITIYIINFIKKRDKK